MTWETPPPMPSAALLAVRFIVTLLAVTAVVGQLAYLDALSSMTLGLADTIGPARRPAFFAIVTMHAVVAAVSGFLGVALATRGDTSRGAIGLAVALVSWSYMLSYSGVGLLLRPEGGLGRSLFDAHFPLIELAGLAGLIRFTALFPRSLDPARMTRPENLAVGLRSLQHLRIRLLSPSAPWIVTSVTLVLLLGANAVAGQPMADAALSPAMDVIRLLAIGLVVLNLRHSWHDSGPDGRRDIWWILVGLSLLVGFMVLVIAGNILLATTRWPEPSVPWRPIVLDLGIIGFLWGLSMSVFYDGPLDGARTACRVLALTAVTTLGFVLATALEVLVSGSLVAQVSLPTGLGAVTAVLVVATTSKMTLSMFERVIAEGQRRMEAVGS